MTAAANAIELVQPKFPRGTGRAAMFDFDGTLSLVRANWQGVMVPMMVQFLLELNTGEDPEQLKQLVEDFVIELTGKPTICQMIQLTKEITKRGGQPREPEFYKDLYHERLLGDAAARVRAMRSGATPTTQWAVGGAHNFLEALSRRGVALYLASGTEIHYVRDELNALGLDGFFGEHVYAPQGDHCGFTKAAVVQRIIAEQGIPPAGVIGFGDGVVETTDVSNAGGLAIGVATDEVDFGKVNAFKRKKLIEAGAHVIVPDFLAQTELIELLFA